jgi:pimeloyl-ACP methyl ester carboxylesterase
MGPVARELSATWDVFEPFQASTSVREQIDELAEELQEHTALPVVLAGYSWGAMLGFLVAAAHPSSVGKLVLIGSGPLDPTYADSIMATRLGRLVKEDRDELLLLQKTLSDPSDRPSSAQFARYGDLIARADSFDPIATEPPESPPPGRDLSAGMGQGGSPPGLGILHRTGPIDHLSGGGDARGVRSPSGPGGGRATGSCRSLPTSLPPAGMRAYPVDRTTG